MPRLQASSRTGASGPASGSPTPAGRRLAAGIRASIFGVGGTLRFRTLVELAGGFDKAAAQVEHLHVSACSSGGESTVEDYYVKAFPDVQTIWAYEGVCPTGSSAVTAIANWEAKTQKTGIKKLKGKRVIFSGGKYQGKEPEDRSAALKRVNDLESQFQEYFAGTKVDSDSRAGDLTDYYRMVVRVAGRGDLEAADKTRLRKRVEVAMRLRSYKNVRTRFMAEHGGAIKAGYEALKQEMPAYSTLSRKDALAAIASLKATKEQPEAVKKAVELLDKGLHQLSAGLVKEDWILDPN